MTDHAQPTDDRALIKDLLSACEMLVVRLDAAPALAKGSVYDFAQATIATAKARLA